MPVCLALESRKWDGLPEFIDCPWGISSVRSSYRNSCERNGHSASPWVTMEVALKVFDFDGAALPHIQYPFTSSDLVDLL